MPDPALLTAWMLLPSQFAWAWTIAGLRIAAGEVKMGDGGTVLQ